ncbi:MAG TPA: hypothetical protein VIJ93_09725, partial [bacterium]
MAEFKPFSIYDDDEEKKKSASNPAQDDSIDLGLEIEDVPTEEDEKARKAMMHQLGGVHPEISTHATEEKTSEVLQKMPFLSGRNAESVEDRAKDLIRKRQDSGKVRDRRKTASIFDKPIEPDKAIQKAKAAWHPLSHQMQAFWFLFPALVFFGLFYLYPMIQGFQISLTHFSPLGKSIPVGWANYERAFQDPLFLQTAVNAAAFTLLSLGLGFWPPILLAILLNEIT